MSLQLHLRKKKNSLSPCQLFFLHSELVDALEENSQETIGFSSSSGALPIILLLYCNLEWLQPCWFFCNQFLLSPRAVVGISFPSCLLIRSGLSNPFYPSANLHHFDLGSSPLLSLLCLPFAPSMSNPLHLLMTAVSLYEETYGADWNFWLGVCECVSVTIISPLFLWRIISYTARNYNQIKCIMPNVRQKILCMISNHTCCFSAALISKVFLKKY